MPLTSKYFWYCNACQAQNSREDGECQFCECEGPACKRDSCSDPRDYRLLDGCTCGGIGSTGSHFPTCQWA